MTRESKAEQSGTSSAAPSPSGSGTGSSGFGERLARIEARMEHVATKEDIRKLRVWVLGGVLGALGIALVAATGVARLLA